MHRAAAESGLRKPSRWSPLWLTVAACGAAVSLCAAVVAAGASERHPQSTFGASTSVIMSKAARAAGNTTGRRSTMSATFFRLPGSSGSAAPSATATQPSTSPGPSSASPTPSAPGPRQTPAPAQPTAPRGALPDGVPSGEVGALVHNLSGADILSTYHQGVMAGTDCSSAPLRLAATVGVDLHTDGQNECAALSSPGTFGTGIFEARIWFDAAGQNSVANWPAFYMVGNPWPSSGEIDAAEGMDGCLQVTYHFGALQSPQQDGPYCVTRTPGWHVVTIVRAPGDSLTGPVDTVYYDGHRVWTGSGYVVSSPEYIVVSNNEGQYGRQPGEAADLWINYIRVWNWH